jgi:predicted nucleic acid-binding protein
MIIVFNSQIVYPKKKLNIVKKDPSDNKILECALEAKASFVISGDRHLLEIKEYDGIKIVSPREIFIPNLKQAKFKPKLRKNLG